MAGADRRCRISGYRNKLGCPKRPADCVIVDLASAHALIIAERQALECGGKRGAITGAVDREAQVHHQEDPTRSVRPIVGTWRAARSTRAATGRFRGRRSASGGRGPNGSRGGEREDDSGHVRTTPGGGADRRPSICRASGSSIPAPAGPAKRSASRPPHRTGRANVRGPEAQIRLHLPLSRQSAVYVRESVDLDVSTLADWVDAAAGMLCRW